MMGVLLKSKPSLPALDVSEGFALLENGDCMSGDEFMRRYERMPDVKAELVNGVVHMASPVSGSSHGAPHANLQFALCYYKHALPKVVVVDNSTVVLGIKNIPQPDSGMYIKSNAGGRTKEVDGHITGPPELVAEISASSKSIDLNSKRAMYRKAGVLEYLVWRVKDGEIDWWQSIDNQYEPLAKDAAGIIRSVVYPGLWLNVPKLLAGDLTAVMATINAGHATPEYRKFAAAHSA